MVVRVLVLVGVLVADLVAVGDGVQVNVDVLVEVTEGVISAVHDGVIVKVTESPAFNEG